jgi:hypothetical protein
MQQGWGEHTVPYCYHGTARMVFGRAEKVAAGPGRVAIRSYPSTPSIPSYIRTIALPKHVSLCYNAATPQQAYHVGMYMTGPWKFEYLAPES